MFRLFIKMHFRIEKKTSQDPPDLPGKLLSLYIPLHQALFLIS